MIRLLWFALGILHLFQHFLSAQGLFAEARSPPEPQFSLLFSLMDIQTASGGQAMLCDTAAVTEATPKTSSVHQKTERAQLFLSQILGY
ncbi:MAG: hypothetical protein WBC90_04375 [Albidovulum sp.]